jgi:TRAP-type transport system small permease protein
MKLNKATAIEKWIRIVLDKVRWPVPVILLAMVLMTVVDVCGRFFFGKSMYGNIDIQELMLVLVVFLVIGYCTLEKRQAEADVVVAHLSKRNRAVLGTITWFLSAVIFGIMAWQMIISGYGELISPIGLSTLTLAIRTAPFVLVAAAGALFICIACIVNFFHSLADVRGIRREETN